MADFARGQYAIYELPVLDALNEPGCALCQVEYASARRSLRSLFHEHVNDLGFRTRLLDAWGFCPTHAREAYSVETEDQGTPLGNSILAQAIIARIAVVLRRILDGQKRTSILFHQALCPACETAQRTSALALIRLAELTDRPLFRDWRAAGGRLCLRHLRACAELTPRGTTGAWRLLEDEIRSLERLIAGLAEYVRKSDYQYADEPKGEEQRYPAEAVRFFEGGAS